MAAASAADPGDGNNGRTTLIERSSGRSIQIDPSKSVLELLEDEGVGIDFGCRTGMCGADPIVIEEGADNLSPPSATELETLRRLGLEGRARLACVCKAKRGPVAINVAADLAPDPTLSAPMPAVDLAEEAGVRRVVIVGNGVAGITAADRLRQASPSLEIDVVSRENHHFYNRMAIGRAIYGRTALDGLDLLPGDWAKKNEINVWLNTIVTDIDRGAHAVELGTGQTLPYDKLILATGARANVPPIPGVDLPGCFVLREATDALEIRAWRQTQRCRSAVVLGGGVLGIEAADSLQRLGLDVTIVHRSGRLMDRDLDEAGSARLRRFLEARGIAVETDGQIAAVEGEDRVTAVALNDGRQIDAQLVLFCIGVQGAGELARDAGLEVRRGILVDDAMRTSDPDIYAIGDVAEFEAGPAGLWTLGTQHAQIATDHMLGRRGGSTVPRTVMLVKLDDFDVVAFGDLGQRRLGQEIFVDGDGESERYRRLVVENGRIVAAVFVGPPGTATGLAELIATRATSRRSCPSCGAASGACSRTIRRRSVPGLRVSRWRTCRP